MTLRRYSPSPLTFRHLGLLVLCCAMQRSTFAQYIDKAVFLSGPERAATDGPRSQPLNIACTFVLDLEVTREGKVSSVKTSESTCDSTVLAQAAARARNYVFSPAPTAPEPQHVRLWCRFGDRVVAETFDDVAMPVMDEGDERVYHWGNVEQAPTFPGGKEAMDRYIERTMHYPEKALAERKEGALFFSFIVEKDGTLNTVKLEKGVESSLDQEGMRLLMHMPKWHPGLHNGDPVRVHYEMPVVFTLPPESHAGDMHGSGSGNGVGRGRLKDAPLSYELADRLVIQVPSVEYAGAERGRIVLDIRVDRNGTVVSAEPGRGTTTTAKDLTNAARKAALATRFDADPKAPEVQQGKATFVFKPD